jgi:NADPH2:quinone reductase
VRAMVFENYGEPEVMRLRDVPVPEPQDSEVLIRVGGHNFTLPFVTGMDAAGFVEGTGANVTEVRQGNRVITWCERDGRTWGSFAELVRVSARNVSPMPKSLNFAQAAAVPIESLTALQSLFHTEKGGMIPSQKVLIHGAAPLTAVLRWALRSSRCGSGFAYIVSSDALLLAALALAGTAGALLLYSLDSWLILPLQ